MSNELHVGFVGLGMMGNPMSKRVLRAGYPLTVYDVRPEPVAELVNDGAQRAANPKELAEMSDVVLTSLPTLAIHDDVYFGTDGLLGGAHRGQVFVETSTVSPGTMRHLASEASAHGVTVVDAAILSRTDFHPEVLKLSAPEVVEKGQITLVVGGEYEDVEKVRPVLGAFGDPILHMGPVGSGATIKVLNAAVSHASFAVACEVFAVAAKAGIDLKKLAEILGKTSAKNRAVTISVPQYLQNGKGKLMSLESGIKDSEAMLEIASELNVPVLMQSVNHAYFQMSLQNGDVNKLPWDGEMMKLFESYIGSQIRYAD